MSSRDVHVVLGADIRNKKGVKACWCSAANLAKPCKSVRAYP
jgi:hypothetical protein